MTNPPMYREFGTPHATTNVIIDPPTERYGSLYISLSHSLDHDHGKRKLDTIEDQSASMMMLKYMDIM